MCIVSLILTLILSIYFVMKWRLLITTATVVPTNSDSDVMFCLQLLS